MDLIDWRPSDFVALLTAVWIVHVVALSVWIVLQKRPALSTLSWILSLAALPVLGLVIYFFLGPQKIRRQRLRRQRLRQLHRGAFRPDTRYGDRLPRRKERLGRLIETTTGAPISSAWSVALLCDGEATFQAILHAVASARHHVHVAFYIYEAGRAGDALRDALIERARAGVQVRLMIDAIGSSALPRGYLRPLRQAGVRVTRFHPFRLAPLRPLLNLRNHRKIVVVDGRVGFTGGINICDIQYAETCHSYHDLHVRIDGPAVGWLQAVFVEDWHYASRQPVPERDLYPALDAGTVATQVLASGPDGLWEATHLAHLQAIWDARERVWLSAAYFVPSEAALGALTAAALRGVDVRILATRHSDTRIVTYAGRSYYDELLQAGVRIHEYLPHILHTKAMLVDDDCVLVGSANFDLRSFRLNFEVGLAFYDRATAALLEMQFLDDFAQSEAIVLPRRIGRLRRFGEACARLLSPLL